MSEVSSKIDRDKWLRSLRPIAKKRLRNCALYARRIWNMQYNSTELSHYRRLERWDWL